MHKETNSITAVLDKSTILSIVMISLLVSILTLSLPIAAQTLINLIAFGKLLQPVVTLSIIVLILMLALGALNVWQAIIIEVIQQKLMVKISLNLTRQFTHLSLENFSAHHGPELVNRFFEITTINKALASLLMYGINLSLQLFFGLLLLLLYHPLFLVFDIFIVLSLLLIVIIPYRKGLASAKEECTQKHQVGSWLEELLTSRFLFRFNNNYCFATFQADKLLVSFLKARNLHFRQLIKHQIGFYVLSALASSLLLGLGGYLVISNQLSLGQLVAAEIILGALIYAFKRFATLLENYYDLMAAEYKIDGVLNLPAEEIQKNTLDLLSPIKNLKIIQKEEAVAYPAKPLIIYATGAEMCQSFTDYLLGLTDNDDIKILINNIKLDQEQRRSLRSLAFLIRNEEWFAGTIYDNLTLHHHAITTERLKELLNHFGLMNKIMQQPEGLKTIIYEWESVFNELELMQILFIRAILANPPLLIIDRALDGRKDDQIQLFLQLLANLETSIILIVTQDRHFSSFTNRLVLS